MARIRGRDRAAPRVLLALFAVAWLSAAVAPCTGFAAGIDPADGVSRNGEHLGHSDGHPASSPAPGSSHDHGTCPRCLPGAASEQGASPSTHAGCDETEGARADRGNVLAKWDLKHSLPVPTRIAAEPSFHPPGLHRALDQTASPSARVPLNIRYCIYLI